MRPRTRCVALAACLVLSCGDDRPDPLGTSMLGDPFAHVDAGTDATIDHTSPATCAPADPDAVPVPPLEGDDYTIELEHENLSNYEGLVRARELYKNIPPLIGDIVVCNGDFENPNIEVGLSNHHFSYSYDDPSDAPEEGYIVNVHAIPATLEVDATLRDMVKGTRVRIWGFEVAKVDFDDNSWWSDSGCNTLVVTHACID